VGKLNPKQVENLSEQGSYDDGEGLRLAVQKSGSKSWLLRYQIAGRRRDMGLGGYPRVSLKEARLIASGHRKQLANGIDPMAVRDAKREAEREAQRAKEAQRVTFQGLAMDYHTAHSTTWSEKWRKGWLRKLELYAFPIIGKKSVGDIETEDVLRVLQPIWGSKTRTADEVRGQIEQVLDAAKARKLRKGDNPARWRGHLDNLLSRAEKKKARKREHFAAMKWQDVPVLMTTLAAHDSRAAVAARLMIFTGARAQMIRLAAWDEFDLESGVWSLPAVRMKMRKAFEIPLAPPVVKMLQELPRVEGSPFLFPGQGKTGAIHANAVRTLLHSLGHDDITRHGFRSSFRDWANERTRYPREVCELALAHDERDQTEAAYSRSDFLEKRRALMAEWACFITTRSSENVIQGEFKRA